jgi:hypothetical protein
VWPRTARGHGWRLDASDRGGRRTQRQPALLLPPTDDRAAWRLAPAPHSSPGPHSRLKRQVFPSTSSGIQAPRKAGSPPFVFLPRTSSIYHPPRPLQRSSASPERGDLVDAEPTPTHQLNGDLALLIFPAGGVPCARESVTVEPAGRDLAGVVDSGRDRIYQTTRLKGIANPGLTRHKHASGADINRAVSEPDYGTGDLSFSECFGSRAEYRLLLPSRSRGAIISA